MTFIELKKLYSFHDCDIEIPILKKGNDLIIRFGLCYPMQNEQIKKEYDRPVFHREGIPIKIRFLQCANLSVERETHRSSRQYFLHPEKGKKISIPLEAVEGVCDEVCLSDDNNFYARLEYENEKGNYFSERISFLSKGANVEEVGLDPL